MGKEFPHPANANEQIDNGLLGHGYEPQFTGVLWAAVILDFFFNFAEGYKEAAEKFKEEAGVTPAVELSTLEHRILILDAMTR